MIENPPGPGTVYNFGLERVSVVGFVFFVFCPASLETLCFDGLTAEGADFFCNAFFEVVLFFDYAITSREQYHTKIQSKKTESQKQAFITIQNRFSTEKEWHTSARRTRTHHLCTVSCHIHIFRQSSMSTALATCSII